MSALQKNPLGAASSTSTSPGGMPVVPVKSCSCHKCGSQMKRTKDPGTSCLTCKAQFHVTDCGWRYSNAGVDPAMLKHCPKCSRMCLCGGGPVICHAGNLRIKRERKRKLADAETSASDPSQATSTEEEEKPRVSPGVSPESSHHGAAAGPRAEGTVCAPLGRLEVDDLEVAFTNMHKQSKRTSSSGGGEGGPWGAASSQKVPLLQLSSRVPAVPGSSQQVSHAQSRAAAALGTDGSSAAAPPQIAMIGNVLSSLNSSIHMLERTVSNLHSTVARLSSKVCRLEADLEVRGGGGPRAMRPGLPSGGPEWGAAAAAHMPAASQTAYARCVPRGGVASALPPKPFLSEAPGSHPPQQGLPFSAVPPVSAAPLVSAVPLVSATPLVSAAQLAEDTQPPHGAPSSTWSPQRHMELDVVAQLLGTSGSVAELAGMPDAALVEALTCRIVQDQPPPLPTHAQVAAALPPGQPICESTIVLVPLVPQKWASFSSAYKDPEMNAQARHVLRLSTFLFLFHLLETVVQTIIYIAIGRFGRSCSNRSCWSCVLGFSFVVYELGVIFTAALILHLGIEAVRKRNPACLFWSSQLAWYGFLNLVWLADTVFEFGGATFDMHQHRQLYPDSPAAPPPWALDSDSDEYRTRDSDSDEARDDPQGEVQWTQKAAAAVQQPRPGGSARGPYGPRRALQSLHTYQVEVPKDADKVQMTIQVDTSGPYMMNATYRAYSRDLGAEVLLEEMRREAAGEAEGSGWITVQQHEAAMQALRDAAHSEDASGEPWDAWDVTFAITDLVAAAATMLCLLHIIYHTYRLIWLIKKEERDGASPEEKLPLRQMRAKLAWEADAAAEEAPPVVPGPTRKPVPDTDAIVQEIVTKAQHMDALRSQHFALQSEADALSERLRELADVSPEEAPAPADVSPEDAPAPADVSPEDAPAPADVSPEDAPAPVDVSPEDAPAPADVSPEDAPAPADVSLEDA